MNNKFPSELRFDIISEDWVIIAKTRKKLPKVHKTKKEPSFKISPKDCPFCNIKGQLPPKLIFAKGQKILPKHNSKIPPNWTTIVIPNKYPALIPARKILEKKEGKFFKILKGVGYCELVVTRDHEKHFPLFEVSQIKEVIDAYQERYQALKQKPFVKYISIFHNHGPTAGASQPHPHSQIITTPLIDNDLKKALEKAKKYYESYQKCIYCEMNEWEMKVKKRIVVENELFLAICPFASKSAFQVIVSPKPHLSYFEEIKEEEKLKLAEIFKQVMEKIYKGLGDPDYNFYLHTAPCDGKKYPFYHWHFTILPKTSIPAGFELGTRMEISAIPPERAARYLRKQ